MTKNDIINEIAKETAIDKRSIQKIVESFMGTVQESLAQNKNIYLRGFGSFIVKKRARKIARDISKNTSVIVPEHYIPYFKPSNSFVDKIKRSLGTIT